MPDETVLMSGNIRRSLRFRIIAMLLVCAGGLLLASMVYSFLSQKQQLQDELNRTAANVVKRLAFTMAQPLWNFDQKHLEELELQELKDPAVLSVLVQATDKELLSVGHRKTMTDPEGIQAFSSHVDENHGTLHRELPMVYNNQQIGSVHVVLTDQPIRHELASLIVQQTLQSLFFLIGITLLTYLGLSRILLVPLHELYRAADSYGKGDLTVRTMVRSDDELGLLGATLNRMAEQVAEKISELEASKIALQESEAFRRRIFESSRLPVTIIDADTRLFVDCNPAALEANGFSSVAEFIGKSVYDVSAPVQYDGTPSAEKAAEYLEAVLKEGQTIIEWRHQRTDGEQWDGEVHLVRFSLGNKTLLQTTTLDITERKKTSALMVQTEKMMMVGGLAAGMAHEINNPLGIITQTAQNIQRRLDPQLPANRVAAEQVGLDLDRLQQYLEARQIVGFIKSIREATDRAARIISNMLKFSRKSESYTEYVELGALFDQVLELAASDYDLKKSYDFKRVTIVREISPDLAPVPISVLELEQVLLNLLKNAAQAMYDAATQQPQITLRTRQEHGFAVIEVEDNGPGMPLDVQKRIFEPFYTTKEVGRGTGLGLSVSYSIITNNHHGRIGVASQPGHGTCFKIHLPLQRTDMHQGASA
jgi:PAS domain S-box-containing protein